MIETGLPFYPRLANLPQCRPYAVPEQWRSPLWLEGLVGGGRSRLKMLCASSRVGSLLSTVVAFTLPHVARRRVPHADATLCTGTNIENLVGTRLPCSPLPTLQYFTGSRCPLREARDWIAPLCLEGPWGRVGGGRNSWYREPRSITGYDTRIRVCLETVFSGNNVRITNPGLPGRRKRTQTFCGRFLRRNLSLKGARFLCGRITNTGLPGRRKRP